MKTKHKVVTHDKWLKQREAFLKKEKKFTAMRDELSKQRRNLPWEKVEKEYVFEGTNGRETLADLFDGRTQLLVYHFMFAPDWEAGCKGCSLLADAFERDIVHLKQRDVTMLAVSRAPLEKLEAFKQRMGWTFKWVSSGDGDFPYDFFVSFKPEQKKKKVFYNYRWGKREAEDLPGLSAFYKNEKGEIFHTYSAYERGLDASISMYQFLDLAPKGRDEAKIKPHPMAWVKHRDRYGT